MPIETICKQCEKSISKDRNSTGNYFCSRSCSAKFNNKGRIRSEQSRIKISEAIRLLNALRPTKAKTPRKRKPRPRVLVRKKRVPIPKKIILPSIKCCTICKNLFPTLNKEKLTCSDLCYRNLKSIAMTAILKEDKNRFKGPHKRSWMEQSFKVWLDNEYPTVRYFEQVHFWNETARKSGWADFVFPKLRLVIELDGNHHGALDRVEADRVRDAYLKSRGYEVLRITHKEYRNKDREMEVRVRLELT